ncbi:MAG: peptide-methionine (S)-S-oxide reductase MsrA [Candidatus Eisenbacteria bacterium]
METLHTATFAGGCFWCLEAVFERLRGVRQVVSGYTGGQDEKPDYGKVCGGETGHAEAIQITFDPSQIGYGDLLRIFFAFHDPTTKDRQGPDVGTQYRSAIFFDSPAQEAVARQVIASLSEAKVFPRPIVTEVAPLTHFHMAEAHHQGYYLRNPEQGYCQAVIAPKVAKLRSQLSELLSEDAQT